MSEHLIGFHLKVFPENIINTYSVDVNAWQNCKNEKIYNELFKDYYLGQNNVQNGLNVFSLKSLSILEHHSRYHNEGYLIALTVCNEKLNHFESLIKMHDINVSFELKHIQDAGWVCLGYDIADYWLTSGLFNINFEKDQQAKLHNRFSGLRNKYGLFDLIDYASEFKDKLDIFVPEHSPFAIYGLWTKLDVSE